MLKNNKRLKNVEIEVCIIFCIIMFVDMEFWVMVDMVIYLYILLW